MLDALQTLNAEMFSIPGLEKNSENSEPNLLGDLEKVGKNKPMGFLSRKSITNSGSQLEAMQVNLQQKGLESKVFTSSDQPNDTDVLFAFDRKSLQALLDKNTKLLKDNDWPTDSDSFILWVANRDRDLAKVVPGRTALYDLIADGFADYENPDRLNPIFLKPREGKTQGSSEHPCYVFGNGVELENRVCMRATYEGQSSLGNNPKPILKRDLRLDQPGIDIVKTHFLPKTSVAERANDPDQVSTEERGKIKIDCLQGFMSLANSLAKNEIVISNHASTDDFYILADTNPGLALFLINACGFRGNARSGQAWIRASEFSTNDNIKKMLDHYKKLADENS